MGKPVRRASPSRAPAPPPTPVSRRGRPFARPRARTVSRVKLPLTYRLACTDASRGRTRCTEIVLSGSVDSAVCHRAAFSGVPFGSRGRGGGEGGRIVPRTEVTTGRLRRGNERERSSRSFRRCHCLSPARVVSLARSGERSDLEGSQTGLISVTVEFPLTSLDSRRSTTRGFYSFERKSLSLPTNLSLSFNFHRVCRP